MQTSSFLSVWFFYLNRYITFQSISLSLCLPLLPLPLRTHTHTHKHAHCLSEWDGNSGSFEATSSIAETEPSSIVRPSGKSYRWFTTSAWSQRWETDVPHCAQGLDLDSCCLGLFGAQYTEGPAAFYPLVSGTSKPRERSVSRLDHQYGTGRPATLLCISGEVADRGLLLPRWGLAEPRLFLWKNTGSKWVKWWIVGNV